MQVFYMYIDALACNTLASLVLNGLSAILPFCGGQGAPRLNKREYNGGRNTTKDKCDSYRDITIAKEGIGYRALTHGGVCRTERETKSETKYAYECRNNVYRGEDASVLSESVWLVKIGTPREHTTTFRTW